MIKVLKDKGKVFIFLTIKTCKLQFDLNYMPWKMAKI